MEMRLAPDFKEFLRLLTSERVEYLLVGGYAVGYYGYPRPTGDLDIWIAVNEENAECYKRRVATSIDGVQVANIAKSDLVANKRAAGRHKDLDDVQQLGG